jgi:hypothetical protein
MTTGSPGSFRFVALTSTLRTALPLPILFDQLPDDG